MSKNQDNITRILKSIKPLKIHFSKIGRQINQTFKYASLNNLIKSIGKKQVYIDKFVPAPDKKIHKNDYDVNFLNSLKYLQEFSDINNLPLVAKNRHYMKGGEFDFDLDIENLKRENSLKYFLKLEEERKKEKIKRSKELLKKYRESDLNLNLGKYNPEYDIIKPRIPKAYIRSPNSHIKDSWLFNCPFRNTFEDFKLKQQLKNKNKNLNNNGQNIKSNSKRNKKKIRKISFNNSYNNSQISHNSKNSEEFPNIVYLSNKHLTNINIKRIKRIKKIKNKSFSESNIKGGILFNKMRKRRSLFKKCDSNISYYPNYEFILPHTPSYVFEYNRNKRNYKKYMNGKIIRSYSYNSDDYYVMQLRKKPNINI